jgi:hypothetical protein
MSRRNVVCPGCRRPEKKGLRQPALALLVWMVLAGSMRATIPASAAPRPLCRPAIGYFTIVKPGSADPAFGSAALGRHPEKGRRPKSAVCATLALSTLRHG